MRKKIIRRDEYQNVSNKFETFTIPKVYNHCVMINPGLCVCNTGENNSNKQREREERGREREREASQYSVSSISLLMD